MVNIQGIELDDDLVRIAGPRSTERVLSHENPGVAALARRVSELINAGQSWRDATIAAYMECGATPEEAAQSFDEVARNFPAFVCSLLD